jgi:hypothetical protein
MHEKRYGYTFGFSTNLSGPLLTQSVLGFGQSAVLSSSFGYISSCKQEAAGAASSIEVFCFYIMACVCIQISAEIESAIGFEYLFVLYAAMSALCAMIVTAVNLFRTFCVKRKLQEQSQQP